MYAVANESALNHYLCNRVFTDMMSRMFAPQDIVDQKRRGLALNDDDLRGFVTGVADGSVTDAQLGGFTMAVYTPLILFANLRFLPKEVRPGPLNIVMMSIASLVYVGFAVTCLAHEFGLVD